MLNGCIERKFLAHILVVDDGSGPEFAALFDSISQLKDVTVIHLGVNCGMGGAIKAGIQYAMWRWPETIGIAVFDADGQHLPEDIKKITDVFLQYPTDFVLGVRDFHNSQIEIPLRSRFGNRVTELLFRLMTGKHISDTQTGLRCYPAELARECIGILRNRYEFQMESLLLGVQKYATHQIPIQTIYEDGNKCSHFNPVRDSIKIYLVLFRFIAASLICCAVDYIVFAVLFSLFKGIFLSLIIARVCSVSLNFVINRNSVFNAQGNWSVQAFQFLLLAVFLFCGSWLGMTWTQDKLQWHPLYSKIIVEVLLFVFSFLIQRLWIFSNSRINERKSPARIK